MTERFATVLLPVKKGLHVLRYVSATDMMRPPRILVLGKPGAAEGIEMLFSPDVSEQVLSRFDDCVAIRASQPATLMVTSIADPLCVSTDVELKLEPIGRPEVRPPAAANQQAPAEAAISSGRFILEGHLNKQGDARAGASGWLGSVGGDDRLEAFSLSWIESIKGVRLSYGCEMPGRGRHMARVPGQMVGTKGQATPITRVFFELNGSQADGYEFVATAVFKGMPARTVTGRTVEIAGPTGHEALTGLRVDLKPREAAALAEPAPETEAAPPAASPEPVPARGRVRVFRAANIAR
jgi:hypothetical protein